MSVQIAIASPGMMINKDIKNVYKNSMINKYLHYSVTTDYIRLRTAAVNF